MKKSKRLLCLILTFVLMFIFIIPIFAVNNNYTNFIIIPTDIGNELSVPFGSADTNVIYKYYIVINISSIDTYNASIELLPTNGETQNITIYISNQIINISSSSYAGRYSFAFSPMLYYPVNSTNENQVLSNTIYIPIYCRNTIVNSITTDNDNVSVRFHSSTSDESTIASEAFQLGYNIGYEDGYTVGIIDSAGYQSDLNLVEHCEQLLGTFVGDDYAHYITPLCLALVVILIYFLFIRWLLALVKSKNVTRVADIIVCTACIIMLVIMYAPMLDLTIHQAQTVYQITADTVVGG